MIVDRVVKRSSENRTYDIDCSQFLPPGVTVVGAPQISAQPATQPPLSFAGVQVVQSAVAYKHHTAPAGTVIRVQIGGGVVLPQRPHQDYWVKAVFVDSAGDTQEATMPLRLDDTP